MRDDEYVLKICLIGSSFELKESVLTTFRGWTRSSDLIAGERTLGVSITEKRVQLISERIRLILVNTMGQEFFGKLRPSYYRGASAVIIMFDKTDLTSFNTVPDWLAEFRTHIPDPSLPTTLVGIKTEVEENVTTEQAHLLAEKLGIQYEETSLNDRERIENIFLSLVKAVLDQRSSEA